VQGVSNFCHRLVAMATSLDILEKEVQIDHLHPKRFHSVKRLGKLVQRIVKYFVSEKSLKKIKIGPKKQINASKITALTTSLPSKLKNESPFLSLELVTFDSQI